MDWLIRKTGGCVLPLLPTLALSLLGVLASTSVPFNSTSTTVIPPLSHTPLRPTTFPSTTTPALRKSPTPSFSSTSTSATTSSTVTSTFSFISTSTSSSTPTNTSTPTLPQTSPPSALTTLPISRQKTSFLTSPSPLIPRTSPLPKTSPSPLPKTSPLPRTSPLPKTSPSPLPKTSPLPRTSPLPKTSPSPLPKTSPSPLPKTSSSPLPKTSPSPLPRTSPLSKTSPSPLPKTSPSPLPKTSPSPLPMTSPLPRTSPLPKTSPSPLPKTSPSPLPKTSPSPFPKTSPSPLPKTSPSPLIPRTSPLPKTSPSPLPKTSPPPLPNTARPHHPRPPKPRRRPPQPLLPQTAPPLFDRQPFTVSWNIPDLVCNRYNITLDTTPFRGVATPAKVPGQFLSMFYMDRLGLYPHVDQAARQALYGGIPQRGDLRASLAKARADINYYIPSRSSRGLAVIDWEEWRPLWDRNWGSKLIYQTLSLRHARRRDRSLNTQQASARAKEQFQAAARGFMSETLALGSRLRPDYLWGFYLFPNCYNHGWLEPGYTGRCSGAVRAQNDQLLWLWEASSALYPSVYLQASLADSRSAALLVRNRVHEALRVSALPRRPAAAPVFVYARPVFVDQNRRFLSQGDLVSTIGESAAVGASGVVLWGASADYDDKASCEALSTHLTATLNPYVANVTAAAQLCSDFLCRGNGRCVRRRYTSDHYLHLSAGSFRMVRAQGRYRALGRPSLADLRLFASRFTCQCYAGLNCAPRLPTHLPDKTLGYRHKKKKMKKNKKKTVKTSATETQQQSSSIKENVKKKPLEYPEKFKRFQDENQ